MLRHKVVRAKVQSVDEESGSITAIVSDESEDRDREIIRAAGWELDDFLKHPVLLASHDYRSLRSQIGEWTSMEVDGSTLRGTAHYYIGRGNPEADWGWELARQGRAAFSVGFIPIEYHDREDIDTEGLWWPPQEYTRQTLLEVSHVSVPSNPNALQLLARGKGVHPEIDGIVTELLSEQSAKQGRVMSAANLERFHEAMATLGTVHTAVCDLGEECPMKGLTKAGPAEPVDGGDAVKRFRKIIQSVYS